MAPESRVRLLTVFLEAIPRESSALAAAARTGLDAPVPTCPEWSVADLVRHTGSVHQWVTEIVRTRASEYIDRKTLPPPPAADDEVVPWFQRGAENLVRVLEDVDPDEAVWNWSKQPRVAAFWPRRMAQETAVHRWDAENAVGSAAPVERALAVDGVDEMFDVFLSSGRLPKDFSVGGSLHLHATDGPGEWLVSIDGGAVEVLREHAKGDAALRGTTSDLLLFLWNRVPASSLEVIGDRAVVEAWSQIKI